MHASNNCINTFKFVVHIMYILKFYGFLLKKIWDIGLGTRTKRVIKWFDVFVYKSVLGIQNVLRLYMKCKSTAVSGNGDTMTTKLSVFHYIYLLYVFLLHVNPRNLYFRKTKLDIFSKLLKFACSTVHVDSGIKLIK